MRGSLAPFRAGRNGWGAGWTQGAVRGITRPMPAVSVTDRVVLAAWRMAAILAHPRFARRHRRAFGTWPDLATPRDLPERMLWRKLFDRNPLFVTFADKLATKDWIAARCPGMPTVPTLWRGTDPSAIPDALLRPGVVLKANHGSGFNLFLRGPLPPRAEIEAAARGWLARGYGRSRGEWHYGEVRPQLLIEPLLGPALFDITVRAGGGRIAWCSVLQHAKQPGERTSAFDPEGRPIDVPNRKRSPPIEDGTPLPAGFARAVAAARVLSREVDFARFDFLAVGDDVHAGEITLFPGSGMHRVTGTQLAVALATWDLRESWFLREGAATRSWIARRYAAALTRAEAARRG
jgi:hypothetical protein